MHTTLKLKAAVTIAAMATYALVRELCDRHGELELAYLEQLEHSVELAEEVHVLHDERTRLLEDREAYRRGVAVVTPSTSTSA